MAQFNYKTATLQEVIDNFKTVKLNTIACKLSGYKKKDVEVYEKLKEARNIVYPEIQGDGRFKETVKIEIGQKFGKYSQVEVVEYAGKATNGEKLYKVLCHTCKRKPEMYGDGIFEIRKHGLATGRLPCGCSKSSKKNQEQRIALSTDKANKKNITILDINDEGVLTLKCNRDGNIWTQYWYVFYKFGGCKKCNLELMPNRKDNDDVVAQRFMDTGDYHTDTIFWRSGKRESNTDFWMYLCPRCEKDEVGSRQPVSEVFEGRRGDMLRGTLPCRCKLHKKNPDNFRIYVLVAMSPNHSFTGYGVTFDERVRFNTHKQTLREAGYEIIEKEVFIVSEPIGRRIERELTRNFTVERQEIEGFKTEATSFENHIEVLLYVRDSIIKYQKEAESFLQESINELKSFQIETLTQPQLV